MAEEIKENAVADNESKKPAKKAKKAKKAKSHKASNYLKELKSELKKITWYSRKDTLYATLWVCVALLILGAILGLVDYGFGQGIALLSSIGG